MRVRTRLKIRWFAYALIILIGPQLFSLVQPRTDYQSSGIAFAFAPNARAYVFSLKQDIQELKYHVACLQCVLVLIAAEILSSLVHPQRRKYLSIRDRFAEWKRAMRVLFGGNDRRGDHFGSSS